MNPRPRFGAAKPGPLKQAILTCIAIMAFALPLLAQTGGGDRPILSNAQLEKQPTFDNLDSALANPDAVYKLSLTDQKLKTLPADFGNLRNLQTLNLSNCKLKSIPFEIRECKNLQVVSLYGNKIRFIPAEMRELKNLEILYLGRNRIIEVPMWLGTLTKLKRLDLSLNPLTPADVANAKRMLPKAHITF